MMAWSPEIYAKSVLDRVRTLDEEKKRLFWAAMAQELLRPTPPHCSPSVPVDEVDNGDK